MNQPLQSFKHVLVTSNFYNEQSKLINLAWRHHFTMISHWIIFSRTLGQLTDLKVVESGGNDLSRVVRKPAFCICENKDADQLCGNREADQRLCFRYTDSTIPLLPKSEISVKPLTIFYGCTAWFVSYKVGNPEDRFSYNEAHFMLVIVTCKFKKNLITSN